MLTAHSWVLSWNCRRLPGENGILEKGSAPGRRGGVAVHERDSGAAALRWGVRPGPGAAEALQGLAALTGWRKLRDPAATARRRSAGAVRPLSHLRCGQERCGGRLRRRGLQRPPLQQPYDHRASWPLAGRWPGWETEGSRISLAGLLQTVLELFAARLLSETSCTKARPSHRNVHQTTATLIRCGDRLAG